MHYKLFIFGHPELFALVKIPMLEFAPDTGHIINFRDKRYKILRRIYQASEVEFYDTEENKGEKVQSWPPSKGITREFLISQPLPELYITELTQF